MPDLYVHDFLPQQYVGCGRIAKQACVKLKRSNFEVSIACDNSVGCLEHLSRVEIRVFDLDDNERDVTFLFDELTEDGSGFIEGSVDNLMAVLAKIDEMTK